MRHRVVASVAVSVQLAACAGAPHGSPAAASPLTSVDTAYYEVAGNSRAEWAVNLPRAARMAGIAGGAPSFTVGHVLWMTDGTRTTSIGCEVQGSRVLLRMGHVMPRLRAGATPSAEDRAAWDAFVARLWTNAHAREEVGARVADDLRRDMKRTRTADCQQLLVANREKLDAFSARFAAAVREDEEARRSRGESTSGSVTGVP